MDYRAAIQNDIQIVAALAQKLWPGHSISELKEEFAFLLAGQEAVLVLALDGGSPIGFAQCQLRHDYVEGTSGGPVAYLEGVFVERDYRGHGVARGLLSRCEAWEKRKAAGKWPATAHWITRPASSFITKQDLKRSIV